MLGLRLGDDPRYRDAVAGFYVDAQALMTMGYRGFSKFIHGKSAPEHSLLKLYGSESLQKALRGLEIGHFGRGHHDGAPEASDLRSSDPKVAFEIGSRRRPRSAAFSARY